MERWFDRSAKRLAAPPGSSRVDQIAERLVSRGVTRRQTLAAAGGIALLAALPRSAHAQLLPDCPPPGFADETKKCPYQCQGFNPSWICCRPEQPCCVEQPQVNGMGSCAVGCCELGQTCCYSPALGGWGCCGCPVGFHHCGTDPIAGQCCRQDQACDVVNFVCVDGDQCPAPNVLCGSVCCPTGEVCAGGDCCQPSKACSVCCGRGEICDSGSCKQLLNYKPPPRQRPNKSDQLDSPKLQTFDSDLAAEMTYQRSAGGGANAAATGYVIAHKKVHLKAHRRRSVAMHLTRRAKRDLARGRKIPAVFTLNLTDSKGRHIIETSNVTILPPRKRGRRRR